MSASSFATKTHCPRGHAYSPENTRVYSKKNGGKGRACRECHRAASRRRYLANPGYWRAPARIAAHRDWLASPSGRASIVASGRRAAALMTDGFVATRLRMPVGTIPAELFALKRAHITAVRLLKGKNHNTEGQ